MSIQNLKPGDLIGFSHRGAVGYGINLATRGIPGWGLSHVARVAEHPDKLHELVLYESTMSAPQPCLIKGHKVQGVQCQDIADRIAGYDGRIWHYPLLRPLPTMKGLDLTNWWYERLGTAYDAPGAIHSRDKPLWAKPEDLTSLFCSEACVADWRDMGIHLAGNKSASGWSPNALGRAALKQSVCLYPRRLK